MIGGDVSSTPAEREREGSRVGRKTFSDKRKGRGGLKRGRGEVGGGVGGRREGEVAPVSTAAHAVANPAANAANVRPPLGLHVTGGQCHDAVDCTALGLHLTAALIQGDGWTESSREEGMAVSAMGGLFFKEMGIDRTPPTASQANHPWQQQSVHVGGQYRLAVGRGQQV
ncbi:hypothetical protein BHE74_00025714 [Ensete ventricosum]|nr:hypothetical protein BHE74_00025714 [Ensete ventricosum]